MTPFIQFLERNTLKNKMLSQHTFSKVSIVAHSTLSLYYDNKDMQINTPLGSIYLLRKPCAGQSTRGRRQAPGEIQSQHARSG
jgi:hypothetical protein